MMETMEARSFASRRPAATSLPAFTLPPPDIPSTRYPPAAAASDASSPHPTSAAFMNQGQNRHSPMHPPYQRPPSASSSSTAATPAGTSSSFAPSRLTPTQHQQGSSVLTPSPGVAGDGLSPSSGIHTGSSQSSQPGGGASGHSMYYQTNMGGNWSTGTPGGSSSAYTFANPSMGGHPSGQLGQPGGLMPGSSFQQSRSLYGNGSPNLSQFGSRASHSPANGENLPQPPSYHGQSPFPTGIGSGNALPPTLPSQGPPSGGAVSTHPMPQSILTSHGLPAVSQSSTPPSNMSSGSQQQNNHHPLPSPNSSYYPNSSTPQQGSFPAFTNGPPPPNSIAGGPGSLPPSSGSASASLRGLASHSGMAPPMGYGSRGHYAQGYGSMPNGPVLANLHSPGTPLTIVGGPMMGGYGHGPPGHGPLPPQIYGPGAHGHPPHHGPGSTHDRPFKCDTCPQSFNRNHDLKRHKRIHLAVKPYPCSFCEKSFSRKDALKRHRLVKGCGEKGDNESSSTSAMPDMNTPPDRSDAISDGTEGSPNVKSERN